MSVALRPSKAPNLPIAPVEYSQQYLDQLANVLRLYFAQVDNLAFGLTTSSGGAYLNFPYVAASDTTSQYATATNTPTIVKWDTLAYGNGFTLDVGNTATALVQGIYKITYSLQIVNNDNAIHDSIVWLQINNTNVVGSTTTFTLPARKSALLPAYVCGYSEVVFQINAGDVVGLWWGTDQAAVSGGATGIYIEAKAAQTSPMAYPATPSSIGSITFISAIPVVP
jgi:hypothetical protein